LPGFPDPRHTAQALRVVATIAIFRLNWRATSGVRYGKRFVRAAVAIICFVYGSSSVTIEKKYVNMADVNFSRRPAKDNPKEDLRDAEADALVGTAAARRPIDTDLYDLVELLFFAYRDFISDPDEILSEYGFGRAHHRVLHFVNRNPGLKVADLLEILNITKQSLGRVLKQLVDEGFIYQREGPSDRRQRLLYTTQRGSALALRLASPQFARFAEAIAATSEADAEAAKRFLMAMVNERERDRVAALLRGGQGISDDG
jgi:DNA-binding MarR family transcriptional regulator